VQARRAIVQDQFENRLTAMGKPFQAERDDLTADGRRFVKVQVGNGMDVTPVFVTMRPMQEEVSDAPHA
jgi:hypothetical protein